MTKKKAIELVVELGVITTIGGVTAACLVNPIAEKLINEDDSLGRKIQVYGGLYGACALAGWQIGTLWVTNWNSYIASEIPEALLKAAEKLS